MAVQFIGTKDNIALVYAEVPTAAAAYVGKIIQYSGETSATYTHGYFYECIETDGAYSWQVIATGETSAVKSRYYANDWFEAIIYSISGSDAAFEIVTNPIPADAIVIDVAVRYTPDGGITYTDIPINELYLRTHGSSPLVAFGDRINLMNNSTYVMNGVRTCATISAAGAGGELISYAAASMSDLIILGFTVYYI